MFQEGEMKQHRNKSAILIRLLTAALMLALSGLFMGCGGKGDPFTNKNMPYEPDTPAPESHEGVFVSDHGTMTFSGDGKSVVINFDKELSECLGLPEGGQEAEYVFMSGYLPPHGNVPVRYDVAHTLMITAGQGDSSASALIDIGEYKDGSFYTGTNCTTADRITFFIDWKDNGDKEAVDFLKQS